MHSWSEAGTCFHRARCKMPPKKTCPCVRTKTDGQVQAPRHPKRCKWKPAHATAPTVHASSSSPRSTASTNGTRKTATVEGCGSVYKVELKAERVCTTTSPKPQPSLGPAQAARTIERAQQMCQSKCCEAAESKRAALKLKLGCPAMQQQAALPATRANPGEPQAHKSERAHPSHMTEFPVISPDCGPLEATASTRIMNASGGPRGSRFVTHMRA